ncbi:MAG TPA: glycosyltransferase family 39 protein [Candidatus Binataceae bacterium]|nr:glycosyltransferase family 39 protein [Candidatus Binataceae bacterium]
MAAHTSTAAPSRDRETTVPPRWLLLPELGLTLLALTLFFFHLGSYGLWEADEPRYAEIAREMAAGGSYLVPHLNYVPYVEKPPLLYWLTALAFHLLGATQFAARLVPAMAAMLGLLVTCFFTQRVFDRRRALLTGAILCTAPLYVGLAQLLTTDMLLSLLLAVAFWSFFLQWREGGRWWLIFYPAVSLAVLTKGPIGAVLPGASGLLFLLIYDRPLGPALRKFHLVAGSLITVALAAPWFVLIALRLPGFVDFYFVGEHLRRFFVATYSHGEPFYFYLPVILLGLMPWTGCLPLLLSDGTAGPARGYCLSVSAVILGLFSLANAKLMPYVLPAIAPLAVLLADAIVGAAERSVRQASDRPPFPFLLTGIIVAAGGAGVTVFSFLTPYTGNPYLPALSNLLRLIGVTLSLGGALGAIAFIRRRVAAGFALLTLTTSAAVIGAGYCRIALEPMRPFSALSRQIAARAPGATLICYHRYIQSLPFYTHQRVILVGPALSELRFGAEHSPDRGRYFLRNDDQLLDLWRRARDPVLVIDSDELSRLGDRLGRLRLLAAESDKRAVGKAKLGESP